MTELKNKLENIGIKVTIDSDRNIDPLYGDPFYPSRVVLFESKLLDDFLYGEFFHRDYVNDDLLLKKGFELYKKKYKEQKELLVKMFFV